MTLRGGKRGKEGKGKEGKRGGGTQPACVGLRTDGAHVQAHRFGPLRRSGKIEIHDDGRVVRGTLALARFAINVCITHGAGEQFVAED